MIASTGTYTPGCIRRESGHKFLLDQEAIDRAYREPDGHYTRSYAHSVYKGGGAAQECLDNGETLFSGNAGTSFGTLVDRAIPALICGHDLESLYATPPESVLSNGARRGKEYLKWKEELDGRLEISRDDLYRVQRIVANAYKNPAVVRILEETTDCQATFRYEDGNGHKRKSLADGVTPEYLWDWKTTSSDWDQLWRSCRDYGYLWQAAWYVDSAMACGWPHHQLKFIFAQSMKPFKVRVYRFPEELVERARDQIARTLDQIRLRQEMNYYSSSEDEEETELEFPAWMRDE